jgi:hypothetical protein
MPTAPRGSGRATTPRNLLLGAGAAFKPLPQAFGSAKTDGLNPPNRVASGLAAAAAGSTVNRTVTVSAVGGWQVVSSQDW